MGPEGSRWQGFLEDQLYLKSRSMLHLYEKKRRAVWRERTHTGTNVKAKRGKPEECPARRGATLSSLENLGKLLGPLW